MDQLKKELDLAQKTKIAQMAEDILIRLHMTVGLFIRNQFFYPHNDIQIRPCVRFPYRMRLNNISFHSDNMVVIETSYIYSFVIQCEETIGPCLQQGCVILIKKV